MTVVHKVLAALAETPENKVVTAEALGKKAGYTAVQVNGALGNWVRTHDNTPVIKVATGLWCWDPSKLASAPPTGGYVAPATDVMNMLTVPAVSVSRNGVNTANVINACDFLLVKRTNDVIILEDVDDNSIWIARRA